MRGQILRWVTIRQPKKSISTFRDATNSTRIGCKKIPGARQVGGGVRTVDPCRQGFSHELRGGIQPPAARDAAEPGVGL